MRAPGILAIGAAIAGCAPAPAALAIPASQHPPPPPETSRQAIVDWPPVVMRCLQWGDSCGGSASDCRALANVPVEAREEASRCFDEPCEEATRCFQAFEAARRVP